VTVRSVAVRDQVVPKVPYLVPLQEEHFTRREALAIQLAGSLANMPWRLSDELFSELRAEFRQEEIVEMIFSCAIYSWGNIIGIAAQLDTAGDSRYGSGLDLDGTLDAARKRQADQ
jgi:alkylhydroperoxidase family enzyme